MASHSDWMHLYRHTNEHSNIDGLLPENMLGGVATAVATTGSATATASVRAVKPVRKRSRASRRTPTTLLNTDTTNFRAMVQQFTGGPTFGSGSNPNFMIAASGAAAFGLASQSQPGGGYQLQFQQPHYQQQNNNVVYSSDLMMGNNSANSSVMSTGVRMEAQGQGTAGPSGGSNVNGGGYMF